MDASNTSPTAKALTAQPYLLSLYITGLLLANATGSKVMAIGPLVLSVGALAYPVTFVMQDAINELFGKQTARKFVGATALALLFLMFFAAISVPIPDAFNPTRTVAYELVFGGAPRIVAASMIAFFVGGLVDVHVFFKARERWPDLLFVRKACSTVVSQAIDTFLFVFIGFAGEMPWLSLFVMALSQYAIKQVVALSGVPLTYFIIHRLR